ncbi:ribonuclease P 40kDa subunit-domain-containing protein [Lactarius psammicola]|nr:ribonuclease P 40kDa subunit-domain-containing protein [Lactarius psammicola]
MAPSQLEKRTSVISTGYLPSNKLLELGISRPFVHQVDVVFPFNHELDAAFRELETDYCTSRAPLSEIYQTLHACTQDSGLSGDLHVASTGAFLPDAWSSREGNIVLSAGKETFEALGLPGVKISSYMPAAPEQHLINVSMGTPNTNVRSHDFILGSFAQWDRSREESGEGQWDFAFHISRPDKGTGPLSASRARLHKIRPAVQHLQNICVPTSALPPRPHVHPTSVSRIGRHDLSQGEAVTSEVDAHNDALQDWNERASVYFEWIGMVNIGAQRLRANDRVDPYVAVYSTPTPFTVGDVTHMKWYGFLTPQFVQKIIDTAVNGAASSSVPLIGLTIHGSTETPVLTPSRMPRSEGEDTVSLILFPGGVDGAVTNQTDSGKSCSWALVEAIGKGDTRFG